LKSEGTVSEEFELGVTRANARERNDTLTEADYSSPRRGRQLCAHHYTASASDLSRLLLLAAYLRTRNKATISQIINIGLMHNHCNNLI
jgi:hypothetical protein